MSWDSGTKRTSTWPCADASASMSTIGGHCRKGWLHPTTRNDDPCCRGGVRRCGDDCDGDDGYDD
jgi:hypothetical protein